MSRYLILIFILVLFSSIGQQQGNIWHFGFGAGLDFNSGSPIAITDGQTGLPNNHIEGTSVISDSSGNLLFYTDGQTVWNRTHQVMPNGTGLLGHYSSTQSSLIIPAPVDPDRYFYIFTVADGSPSEVQHKAHYSIVDLCLDNGLGDILTTEKNVLLGDTLPEKMTATRHANGVDYWVLTHKFYTNEFWAFKLTSAGVVDTVISSSGSVYGGNMPASFGQMKLSPDGTKLALGAANLLTILELHDFDPATGIVSNAQDLYGPSNDNFHTYGVEFSPDNTKLYVRGRNASGIATLSLAQYDLSAGGGNINSINASMYLIYQESIGILSGGGMQLGPDGVIYTNSKSSQGYLASINNPNSLGVNCNFQDSSIYLLGKTASNSLPGFVANYDYSNTINKCEHLGISEINQHAKMVLFPNPTEQWLNIEFTHNENELLTIVIVDFMARTVHSHEVKSGDPSIDISEIEAGTYLVKAMQNGVAIYSEVLIKK